MTLAVEQLRQLGSFCEKTVSEKIVNLAMSLDATSVNIRR